MIYIYIIISGCLGIGFGLVIAKLYTNYLLKQAGILTGKSAERFYREINDGEMSKSQEKFLKNCKTIYDNMRKEE